MIIPYRQPGMLICSTSKLIVLLKLTSSSIIHAANGHLCVLAIKKNPVTNMHQNWMLKMVQNELGIHRSRVRICQISINKRVAV